MTEFPAGWYPDPDDATLRRYWDGATWSAPIPIDGRLPAPDDTSGGEPRHSRRAQILVGLGAVVAAAVVVTLILVFAGSSNTSKKIRVAGSITISGPDNWTSTDGGIVEGTPCFGKDGYDDLAAGAEVVIADDSGKTLAITALGSGRLDASYGCALPFSATVPGGEKFYSVTVSHRGTIKETEAELADVQLTIGS